MMWAWLSWSEAAFIFPSGFKADECRMRAEPWRLDFGNKGNKQIYMHARPHVFLHKCMYARSHEALLLIAYKIAPREAQCNSVRVQNGFWLQACGRKADPLIQHREREDAVHPLSSSGPLQNNENLTEQVDLHSLHCYPLTTWSMAGTKVLKWGLQVIPEVCQLTEEYLIILLIREDWLLWTCRSHHCTTVCRIDSTAIIPEITDIKPVKVAIVSCSCWHYMCSVGSANPCEQCRLCAMLKEMHVTH